MREGIVARSGQAGCAAATSSVVLSPVRPMPSLSILPVPSPSSSIPGVLVLLCSGPHGAQRAVTTESAGAPRTSDLGEGERRVCVCVCVCVCVRERQRERERERERQRQRAGVTLGLAALGSAPAVCRLVCLSCASPAPTSSCVCLWSPSHQPSLTRCLPCLSLSVFSLCPGLVSGSHWRSGHLWLAPVPPVSVSLLSGSLRPPCASVPGSSVLLCSGPLVSLLSPHSLFRCVPPLGPPVCPSPALSPCLCLPRLRLSLLVPFMSCLSPSVSHALWISLVPHLCGPLAVHPCLCVSLTPPPFPLFFLSLTPTLTSTSGVIAFVWVGLDWWWGEGGGSGGAGGVGRDGGRLEELRWPPPEQGVLRGRGPVTQGGWGRGPWAHAGRGLGLLTGRGRRQSGPHVQIWRQCSGKTG